MNDWQAPEDSASHGLWKQRLGGVSNYIYIYKYLGTVLNLTSMEDNKKSIAIRWQEQPPPKTSFISHLQIKSSSTWLIPCFPLRRAILILLCRVSIKFFEHFLESTAVILSVMCLSQNTIDFGITMVLKSFDIFISSLLLNFRGVLAFMFCSTNKGKRDTTLSYYVMNIAILHILMFHVAYYY